MAEFHHKTSGYARRGMLLVLVLLALGAILFGTLQWKIYNSNLRVSDANLSPLPSLNKTDRLLILSPHPDDETLGAGGLMAQAADLGIPVRVVFMTNGDGSLATRLVQDANFVEELAKGQDPKRPRNIYQQIAPMRQKEALAALGKLSVSKANVTFLGYPDGGTKKMWETNWSATNPFFSPYTKTDHSPYDNSWTSKAAYSGQQALQDVEQIIVGFKPTIVITTNPYDTHPDHWAAYAYLNAAVAKLKLQQKYFSWAGKIQIYSFIVHHGLWPAPHGYHPDQDLSPPADLMQIGISWLKLNLNTKNQSTKTTALAQYGSQLSTTPQFLRGFLRRNELFAQSTAPSSQKNAWQQIIEDPRNDLLLPKIISAADITAVSIKEDDAKVLSLRIELSGKPRKDVRYQVTIHPVSSQKVSLCQVVIGADVEGKWKGKATSAEDEKGEEAHDVKVITEESSVTIELPLAVIESKLNSPSAYLLSAASLWRARALDQTPTAIFHINS